MFLIAGGPGQGSAHVFGLGTTGRRSLYRFLFPGYTLVAYDDRGTGESGLLDCPALQARGHAPTSSSARPPPVRATIGPAARLLQHRRARRGPRRRAASRSASTRSRSTASRTGRSWRWRTRSRTPTTSSGCCSTRCCRRSCPTRTAPTSCAQLPATLNAFCSDGGCRAATQQLRRRRRRGRERARREADHRARCCCRTARRRRSGSTGSSCLATVLDADLNPGLAAELPGRRPRRAARQHAAAAPARATCTTWARSTPSIDLSFGLYAATVCRDGPFPWRRTHRSRSRPAILKAAVGGAPARDVRPVRELGVHASATRTSASAGRARPAAPRSAPGRCRTCPMLAVSGGFDMRTPTANAAARRLALPAGPAARRPRRGPQHDRPPTVRAAPPQAVRAWMPGGRRAGTVPALGAARSRRSRPCPRPGRRRSRGRRGDATRSRRRRCRGRGGLADGERRRRSPASTAASSSRGAARLHAHALQRSRPASTLSGTLRARRSTDLPLGFQGTLTVGGAGARRRGILGLSTGTSLRGTLGGRLVGALAG